MALGLALAAQSACWAQTSGTDTSVSGSSKMGTKAGSHNGQAGERISREISEDANNLW